MTMSLTDSLRHNRYRVVSVDKAAGRLRIKSEADICSDLGCGQAEVVTDEGRARDLAEINPGDIITLEHSNGQAKEIRVVRRVFDEYSSPEW
jgi:translation initiation factor IF-1